MSIKIAILGSTGFIGKNLVGAFTSKYEVNEVSVREAHWKNKCFDSAIMINLIGKAHSKRRDRNKKDYYHVNFELSQQIFKAFMKSTSKLLIHISSIAAAEEFESKTPLTEESQCHPNSWYGQSKRAAEEWLLQQKLPVNKKLIILRPPMIHGPSDKGNLRMLYKFISKGIPYPLAKFNNERTFLGIDNFNFFIKKIIENSEKLEAGIYHVCDDEPLSTNQIIHVIKELLNKQTKDIGIPKFLIRGLAKVGDFLPLPINTIRLKKMTSNLLVSNQKIKTALGIEALPFTAEEGLRKTIESFRS